MQGNHNHGGNGEVPAPDPNFPGLVEGWLDEELGASRPPTEEEMRRYGFDSGDRLVVITEDNPADT